MGTTKLSRSFGFNILQFKSYYKIVQRLTIKATNYQIKQFNTVSQNHVFSINEVAAFLNSQGLEYQKGPTCIRCQNPFVKSKPPTCYINNSNGYFCSTTSDHKGSWELFKESVLKSTEPFNKSNERLEQIQKANDIWKNETICLTEFSEHESYKILELFNIQAIPLTALIKHKIRLSVDQNSIVIPWFKDGGQSNKNKDKTVRGIKMISIHENIFTEKILPYDSYNHIFGLSKVMSNMKKVIVTSSEFDAISINSSNLSIPAVSLPQGCSRFPLDILPHFERFSEIIFWFDNLSWAAAKQFSKKLVSSRCKLVSPNAGSALSALQRGINMEKVIRSSVSANTTNIVRFSDLRSYIQEELANPDKISGIKWTRFPHITNKLKGHRRGEMTVLTGPTGSGKTTFLSEYSLDLAMKGVATLWGSFEITNVRLFKTMLRQFHKTRLEDKVDQIKEATDDFQSLPIYAMNLFGAQNVEEVLMTMKQAAYLYDIQHIVIDNLQFMLGHSNNFDRLSMQDNSIADFRKFASTENIHVTLVIHPRKEDDAFPLQMSSVFGGAKATQEADNVLILQNYKMDSNIRNRYLEVVKNRYDGDIGRIPLYFDKDSLCMSKPTHEKTDNSQKSEKLQDDIHVDKLK